RRIWRLNRELGPARSVRVIAMDLPGWPPADAMSPAALASLWARRDSVSWARLQARTLGREPRARLLVLVDGLHALQTEVSVRTGGRSTVRFPLLAERFRRELPAGAVWSGVIDAQPGRGSAAEVARWGGTSLYGALRRNLADPTARLGVQLIDGAPLRIRDIRVDAPPGVEVVIEQPLAARLADGYIYLGG